MEYQSLEKGKIYNEFIGQPEAPVFEFHGGLGFLYIRVHSDLIKECELDKPYDFSLVPFKTGFFICLRWGLHDYISMPFNPHRCSDLKLIEYDEAYGLGVNVILVDVDTGKLADMVFIVLGHEFSVKFIEECRRVLFQVAYNETEYNNEINEIYAKYKTDRELAKISKIKYSIKMDEKRMPYKDNYTYDELRSMKRDELLDKMAYRLKEKFGRAVFTDDEITRKLQTQIVMALDDFTVVRNDDGTEFADHIAFIQDEDFGNLIHGKIGPYAKGGNDG